jgi:hypothetical protein
VVAWVVGMRVEEVEGKCFEGSVSQRPGYKVAKTRGEVAFAGWRATIGRRWIRRKRPGVLIVFSDLESSNPCR